MLPDVVQSFYRVYHEHNLELLDQILSPAYVGMVNGQQITGVEAARSVIGGFLSAFPDIAYTIEDALLDGRKVAVRWTARATHAGRFAAIEPTGRQVHMQGMTIFQTTPAQIEALWNIWDVAGLLQQLQAAS